MNRGTYGYPSPPNFANRLAPPRWTNVRAYTVAGTYTNFIVPSNVFQIGVMVVGAGGGGAMGGNGLGRIATGGGGGGFAYGILDVIPGQALPTITVGAGGAALFNTGSDTNGNAGGTSSVGTLVSCTGGGGGNSPGSTTTGNGGTGGTATASGLRNVVTCTGGRGGNVANTGASYQVTGGGSAGSFFVAGNGGDLVNASFGAPFCATGGAGWGGNGGSISSTTLTGGATNFAFGGGAYNVNAAVLQNQNISSYIPSSGAGTMGRGALAYSTGTAFGGAGITGAPTPLPQSGSFFYAAPSGSGTPTQAVGNIYLAIIEGAFSGAGGTATNATGAGTWISGDGGFGGGGAGITNGGAAVGGLAAGNGGVAGGGGAVAFSAAGIAWCTAGNGGFFGGGGGNSSGQSATFAKAGDGGNGGGGGGISTATVTTRLSGAGGDGAVILYWTEGY